MLPATLATAMLNLVPAATELEAAQVLADAYGTFASTAAAGAVPITPLAITNGKTAMTAALVGMSASGAGAAKIAAGVIAFWGAVAAGLTTSFAGAVVITPPPNAGLAAALSAQFASNIATMASQAVATASIASVMAAQAIIGGTVTFPLSIVLPII